MSPAPHPRMHGLTHVPGGPDPIPGLPTFPGADLDDVLLESGLDALWKLNEPDGVIAYDSSGNDWHLQVPSGHVAPEWGGEAGPPGEPTAFFQAGVDDYFSREDSPPLPAYNDDFTAACWVRPEDTGAFAHFLMGQGNPYAFGGLGWMMELGDAGSPPVDGAFFATVNDGSGAGVELVGNNTLTMDGATWYYLALVRDSGVLKLYVDGLLQANTVTGEYAGASGMKLGDAGAVPGGEGTIRLDGLLSYCAVWPRALSSVELLAHIEAAESGVGDTEGWVWGLDENGNPTWQPPGVEVEHGGGEPDENAVTSPPPSLHDGPTSAGGWYYTMHRETLVLYDSTPARFDVPSRKWTRVPFNTARIQRTWELVPGGSFKEAWLPDDRGVTAAARDGVLKVTADMLFDFGADVPAYPDTDEQYLGGWFAIEYPVLEDDALPQSSPPDPDGYVRAARIVNTRTGQVVRDGTDRAFYQWYFSIEGAAGGAESIGYPADNPYPVYPHWAARPLSKPLPYPQMSPTDSLIYYQDTVGNPSFGGLVNDLKVILTGLVAGDSFVLQAWQDTPWPLRFSTDHFPNFGGFHDARPWINQPWLKLEYYYDPETIDHTTGALL